MKNAFLCSIVLPALAVIAPLTATADNSSLAAADNGFAFKLLRQLVQDQPTQNIFISPYSASTVLQMVGNGSAGQTKTEMQSVLGTASLPTDDANTANKNVLESLSQNTNVVLTTANAIWCRAGIPFKPDFLAENRDFFDATVESIDFADPAAVEVINHWASEKTHGKIPEIANGMIDPTQTQMLLANAVYFKGKWEDPFDASDTKDRPFHLRDGSQKTVPMMIKSKTFTYRHGTGYQAVRLPYLDDNLSMYVFLPDTNSSPEDLLSILNGDKWRRITKPGFSDRYGTLVLPKFKLNYSVELKTPLKSLGIKAAFDSNNADFSGINSEVKLYISDAMQKTFVEVKEEGTEAAAVSGIAVATGGIEMPPQDPFEMIVDRPFLFLIEDSQTGIILFMGVVFDPQPS